jgi:hypothetical protein
MTLRQQYARPRPRAICRRPGTSWAEPPSRSYWPARISLAYERNCQQPPPANGGPCPLPRPGLNSARSRGPATG